MVGGVVVVVGGGGEENLGEGTTFQSSKAYFKRGPVELNEKGSKYL